MFGRQARLLIDIIFGIPHIGRSTTTEKFVNIVILNPSLGHHPTEGGCAGGD